jgi:uncharacterized protein (TIGR02147 family)
MPQNGGKQGDYRSLLQRELLSRIQRNPRYSVRAMARDLSLSSAFLSQVLNGRRSLSEEKGVAVAARLSWTTQQSSLFLQLIRLARATSPTLRGQILAQLPEGNLREQIHRHFRLGAKRFQVVSDWYHFAILELTELRGFRADPEWIGRKLGIRPAEARDAVSRLVELGLLESRGKRLRKKDCSIGDTPSEAIRKFHRQHLEKAGRALETQPVEERHLSGITMAVNTRQLPWAIRKIARFRREMMAGLETGPRDQVYHLSVQLYRLSEKEPE